MPRGIVAHAGAQADIERVLTIWRECLTASKGPFLFGKRPCMADAMFVCSRFTTYDVKLDRACASYWKTVMDMLAMQEWISGAMAEPDELEELDVEF
jgi:glutathione S-transferase